MNDHVVVPVWELERLEQSRIKLCKFLETRLSKQDMLHAVIMTEQMWKVATCKKWND